MKKLLLSLFFSMFFAACLLAQPAAPPVPTVSTNLCGDKVLTRVAPPVDVTYYWQGTSCGTLITSSALTYTVTASGTYYLRAVNTASVWSTTCASVSVVVNPVPAAPTVPTVSTNACGDKTITRVAPPAGITYYWQGTSCGATSTNSNLTYVASASGTYYINAYSSAGCWSTCSTNSVAVTQYPATPPTPAISSNLCGEKILTRVVPPAGVIFYWQGTSCSTLITNANLTDTVTASGTYYLAALAGTCWSVACADTFVVYNEQPTASFVGLPDTVLISAAAITLTGAPSGGIFSGNGITGSVFTPATAGVGNHTITYTYSSPAGCSDFDAQMVYVKDNSGIESINYDNFISIYPMPTKGLLTINIGVFSNDVFNYSIVNTVGKLVKTGSFTNQYTQQLDLGSLSNGIYFLKLQNDNVSYTKKLIIQK